MIHLAQLVAVTCFYVCFGSVTSPLHPASGTETERRSNEGRTKDERRPSEDLAKSNREPIRKKLMSFPDFTRHFFFLLAETIDNVSAAILIQ